MFFICDINVSQGRVCQGDAHGGGINIMEISTISIILKKTIDYSLL